LNNPTVHVYELKCPECADSLHGASGDRLFVCASCQKVYGAMDGILKREPLYVASPIHSCTAQLLWLPFWRFAVDIHIRDGSGEEVTSRFRTGKIRHAWVAAFYEVRPSFLGNPGLTLTTADVVVEPMLWPADRELKLSGAARREEDARAYPRPFISGIIDREKDISNYRIDVSVQPGEFWAVPFDNNPTDRTLTELLTGTVYPAAVVECFEQLVTTMT
jgi:hypothetical protein